MPRIDTVRYLGVYFACSRKLKCSSDHAKRSFYRSVTTVFGEVGRLASEDVVLHLVDSTCMHILLYAVEVCPLSQSDIGSLDFAIFRFLMKSFQTNKKDIIDDCCSFLNFKLPSERIHNRKIRFDSIYDQFRSYHEMIKTYNYVNVRHSCIDVSCCTILFFFCFSCCI